MFGWFLRADRSEAAAAWWSAAERAWDQRTCPGIVGEFLRHPSSVSIVHDGPEGEEAVTWARTLPGWDPQRPALWNEDPFVVRGVTAAPATSTASGVNG